MSHDTSPTVIGAWDHPSQRDRAQQRDYLADGVEAMERLQAEQQQQAYSFTHGGEQYQLRSQVDLRVPIALQRGQFARALELALEGGLDDVDRLLASDEPLDDSRLTAILEGWAQAAAGGSLGESSAS